ncbi:MAG: hypothetical protein WDA71_03740 [Actinomycetota bacterium]
MKANRLIIGLVIALALVASLATWALASDGPTARPGITNSRMDWEKMHNSAGMRQMHEQMPPEIQAQCEAMHQGMVQGHPDMEGMMDSGTGPMAGHHGSSPH